jgi:hypothetical protein
MLPLSNRCKHIYFPNLVQIKDLLFPNVAQTKERSYRNQHIVDQFLFLAIEVFGFYINKLICFYMIVPMPFGA